MDVRFLVNLACACVADVRRGRARGFRAREEESSRPPVSLERGLAPKFPSKNNRVPNLIHLGIPHRSEQVLESESVTEHICVRFFKYDLNQLQAFSRILWKLNFNRQ